MYRCVCAITVFLAMAVIVGSPINGAPNTEHRKQEARFMPSANLPSNSALIPIVSNGASRYVVVLPADPSASETLASDEIIKYIRMISGAQLKSQTGGVIPDEAIMIGTSSDWGACAGYTECPDVNGDSYAITVKDSRIFLTGGQGRSVLYAAYDLLNRLGCRWLAPGFSHYKGDAESIPRKTSLVLRLPSQLIENPQLAIRKLDVAEGRSHDTESLKQLVD